MSKQTIIVRRWRVWARRLAKGLKGLFSSFLLDIRNLGRRRRPGAKINLLGPQPHNGRPKGSAGQVIRIGHRPEARRDAHGTEGSPPAVTARPPAAGKPVAGGLRGGNINVTEGLKLCKACSQPFEDEDELARCRRDRTHTIHRRCVPLMMHKCPHCGGPVS